MPGHMQEIDLEKQPFVTVSPVSPSPMNNDQKLSNLALYQALVGDVTARGDANDDSLYHEITTRARKARHAYILYGLGFGLAVTAQIVLCLGIAAGAQLGLSMNAITILASINTAVAASIAVLKGLGVPDKIGNERYRLEKLADRIRFTTRKLKAGLSVDAAKEAEDVRKEHEDAEDEAELRVGEASGFIPGKK